MKVTIIGPAYPLRGGIAHHAYWLWQELTGRGHSVQVISFRRMYPRIFFPGTTEMDTSRLKLDAGAVPMLTSLNPVTWFKAIKAVKAFGPEAVVFEWWQPFFGLLAGVLARSFRKAGLKFIFECHNIVPHEGSPIDRMLSRFAFSPADYFITHSIKDEQQLLAIAPGKRTIISPLPVLDEFCGTGTRARNGRTILFFGKVRKYKGLGVLINAMPKVLAHVECELLIVGEFYEPVEKYRQMIRDLGIERGVRILNRYVPNEEVTAVFDQADVLALPYVSTSQSGVARIALSNAMPIIASKTGGLSDLIEENVNGLLFPPGDASALADQIINYFTSGLGPVFAENIRNSSREKSDCRIVEFIEAIMQDAPTDTAALST